MLPVVDSWVLRILFATAVFAVLNALDELWIDVAWLWLTIAGRIKPTPSAAQARSHEAPIAVFVPLWHEDDVIADMLARNIGQIGYTNYEIFVGAYPNDPRTLHALRKCESRWPNVHVALCPHDGPTSKADCLNWIYQRMLLFEEEHACRFEMVVVHDAEDVIDSEELVCINVLSRDYDFIQMPVLPLPTSPWDFTHGVYCDEFAQTHMRDLPVRGALGGFVPSAGVGTGYSRAMLERLADTQLNRIFEPSCLTEDYENGLRLHSEGAKQIFLALQGPRSRPRATREYFPRTWRGAVRQRTRWITGIGMQTWQRHGWRPRRQLYWLWRDRKNLVGNPLNLVSAALFCYGLATQMWARVALPQPVQFVIAAAVLLQLSRTAVRIGCTARWFGAGFAALEPVREIYAGILNSVATLNAACRFGRAWWKNEPLVWLKTEHAFPSRSALENTHRLLGAVLTGSGYLETEDLDSALATKPEGYRIGEWLVKLGRISEQELYEALSLQSGLPLASADEGAGIGRAARALPARILRQWQVLPFRISSGELSLAAVDTPPVELESTVRACTSLAVRFHLMTPSDFEILRGRSERALSEG